MRSPAGFTSKHIDNDGYGYGYGAARRRIVVCPPPAPAPTSWTTSQIVDELRGAIGQTLVELRAENDPKGRSIIISHLCRSIAALVGIAAMDSADLTTMSDKELIDLGQKLIRDMVRA